MWGKIKYIFGVFFRGAAGGLQGLAGAAMVLLSLYFLTGLFTGTANIQNYIGNKKALGQADGRIEALEQELNRTNLHIRLMQSRSPDFVSEMAMKHLNLGDPGMMILKK